MQLRIAAAEPDHLAGRQLAIAQWAKAHHLHAAARQQRRVIGVIKIEGLIVGEGQRQSFAGIGGKLFSPSPIGMAASSLRASSRSMSRVRPSRLAKSRHAC